MQSIDHCMEDGYIPVTPKPRKRRLNLRFSPSPTNKSYYERIQSASPARCVSLPARVGKTTASSASPSPSRQKSLPQASLTKSQTRSQKRYTESPLSLRQKLSKMISPSPTKRQPMSELTIDLSPSKQEILSPMHSTPNSPDSSLSEEVQMIDMDVLAAIAPPPLLDDTVSMPNPEFKTTTNKKAMKKRPIDRTRAEYEETQSFCAPEPERPPRYRQAKKGRVSSVTLPKLPRPSTPNGWRKKLMPSSRKASLSQELNNDLDQHSGHIRYEKAIIKVKSSLRKAITKEKRGHKKNVRYGKVAVYEFPMTLGNNPAVRGGPPLQIDWAHQNNSEMDVSAFECFQRSSVKTKRKSKVFSAPVRAKILLNMGFTLNAIAEAIIEVEKTQSERVESIIKYRRNRQKWDRFHNVLERTFNVFRTIVEGKDGDLASPYKVSRSGLNKI